MISQTQTKFAVPWEEFRKQLEPKEEEAWAHIVYMAKALGEPQKVTAFGYYAGIVWPSGLITSPPIINCTRSGCDKEATYFFVQTGDPKIDESRQPLCTKHWDESSN